MENQDHIDYCSMPTKNPYSHDWSRSLRSWDIPSPSASMPIWQYTTAVLHRGDPSSSYFTHEPSLPLSPGPMSSALPSPIAPSYPTNIIYSTSLTPTYMLPMQSTDSCSDSSPALHSTPKFGEAPIDAEEDEEDSDTYAICEAPQTCPHTSKTTAPSRPSHRRSQSATEVPTRSAKRAHTVVERNYRERLNDKIADLAQYLFETSSDSRTKPSKSLVMTRAKERLKQLEVRNSSLESEVTKLSQHIAILEHIVSSSRARDPRGELGPS